MILHRNGQRFSITRWPDRYVVVGCERLRVFPFFPTRASRRSNLRNALEVIERSSRGAAVPPPTTAGCDGSDPASNTDMAGVGSESGEVRS